MHGTSDEDILRIAARDVHGHPGALAWIDGPLRKHLATAGTVADVPDALRRRLCLSAKDLTRYDWIHLAPALAEAIAAKGHWPPRRTRQVPVEVAIGYADLGARQEANRLRLSSTELRETRAAIPRVTWRQTGPREVVARFVIGRLGFACAFQDRGSTWERHWMPDPGTTRILRAMGARHMGDEGKPTGLFPVIDATLRAITREFLDRFNPQGLAVNGSNARRNAHNASTYGDIMPEEYGLAPIHGYAPGRATQDGVAGVRFTRLPEAAPAFPVPLEEGVLYGEGGVPLPDLREARALPREEPSSGLLILR